MNGSTIKSRIADPRFIYIGKKYAVFAATRCMPVRFHHDFRGRAAAVLGAPHRQLKIGNKHHILISRTMGELCSSGTVTLVLNQHLMLNLENNWFKEQMRDEVP